MSDLGALGRMSGSNGEQLRTRQRLLSEAVRVSRPLADARMEAQVARLSALAVSARLLVPSARCNEGLVMRAIHEVRPDPAAAAFRSTAYVDLPFNLTADAEDGRQRLQDAALARGWLGRRRSLQTPGQPNGCG
jgi:hypothetical protein